MSKKLFVLLLTSMILITILILTLTLTGHEQMIVSATEWATRSISNVVKILGTAGIIIVIVLLMD